MNLSELLSYTSEQYLDDSTALVDGSPDSLWSNEFLVLSLNEAQRQLARAAWCIIAEGVTPAGIVTLVDGQAVYNLHASVLRVLLATPEDQDWPLFRSTDDRLRAPRVFEGGPFVITGAAETGRPVAFSTDAGTRKLRIYRTPTALEDGLVINLKVARLPITWLAATDMNSVPEVPEDYHEQMCRYAAGRALTLPNVDGAQKAEGRTLLQEFREDLRDARRDRQRAEMDAAPWSFSSTTALLDGYPW